jgi:hypothetical protein
MPLDKSILIETPLANRDNLSNFLDLVRGCWKCSSLLWLQTNGFPVLQGLILSGWSQEAAATVSEFCRDRHLSELLVRVEKPDQRWTRRRGGYTIPLNQVRKQVEELAAEGMFTILLEPADPYTDRFSLTCVCDLETCKVDVEVVGSGFDASDILRGDILPHERFELSFGDREQRKTTPSSVQVKRVHLVGREDYQASVQQRLVKIGARLRKPSFPEEVITSIVSSSDRAILVEEAEHFLRTSGQTALLDLASEYEPIPSRLLNLFLDEFLRLFQSIRASKIRWRTLSLASSFLPQDRLVIWDFFSPGEHDTTDISRL